MSTEGQSAQALARRLIARTSEGRTGGDAGVRAAQSACEFASFELSLSLGAPGFQALLRRAVAQSAVEFPFLAGLPVSRHPDHVFDGVDGLIKEHDPSVVAAALENVLELMFASLGRLIGDDLVARLVERDMALETHNDVEKT